MRSLFRWVAFGVLATSTAVAVAQQTRPIQPNYARHQSGVAWNRSLPNPNSTIQAVDPAEIDSSISSSTTGVSLQGSSEQGAPMTIPQQGSVTMAAGDASSYLQSTCSDSLACGAFAQTPGFGLRSFLQHFNPGNYHCPGYFGGLYYLNLWRDDENFHIPLATSVADPATPLLDIGDARMKDADGGGVRVGKMINSCWAIEGIYWQIDPDDGFRSLQASQIGSNLNSTILFTDLTYDNLLGGGPVPVDNYYQNSQYLSLTRTYDYRNFEINFLRLPYVHAGSTCGGARLALLGGVRYFRADESFNFYTDPLNEINGDDPTNELHYLNEVENHMVGFQLGAMLDYCVTSRLSAQLGSKFGIYNNHQKQLQVVASGPGGGGGAIIGGAGPYAGQPFALETEKDDVSFLTELDAGLAFNVTRNWRVTGGYKVLAVSGYVDSSSQIPYHWNRLDSTAVIKDNDSLILHGIYAGVEYAW